MKLKDFIKLKWKVGSNAQIKLSTDKAYHIELQMDQDGNWTIVLVEDSRDSNK